MPILRVLRFPLALLAAWLMLAGVAAAVPCDPGRCASFPAPGATGPVIAGPDDNLWFLGDGFVGKMDLNGSVTRFAAPVTTTSDLTAGPDGALYFTAPGVVGRMGTDGQYSVARSGVSGAGAIATTPDGTVWLGAAGSVLRLQANDIVSRAIDPSQLSSLQTQTSKSAPAGPSDMVRGADGALWFAEPNRPAIGRLGADGKVTDFPLPPEFGDQIGAIAAGPDGGVWFTAPKGFRVGRVSTSGHFSSYRTSWNPYAIAAGPSHAIWFAMTDSGRWTIVRLVPAGYMTYWQVSGPVKAMGVGPDGAVYLTKDGEIERMLPFLGAYPIRSRKLPMSPWTHAVTLRFYCPQYDLVYCAGTVTLRAGGRVVGSVPFSQRVNDAPSTRVVLNRLGSRLVQRRGRLPVEATLRQHDNGGAWRTSVAQYTLVRRHK